MIKLIMLLAVLSIGTDANACCLFKRHHRQDCNRQQKQQSCNPKIIVICVPCLPLAPVTPTPVPVTPAPQCPPVPTK
jgi:hypothetical protein